MGLNVYDKITKRLHDHFSEAVQNMTLIIHNSAGRYQVRYAYHDTYTLVSQYTLSIATQPNINSL